MERSNLALATPFSSLIFKSTSCSRPVHTHFTPYLLGIHQTSTTSLTDKFHWCHVQCSGQSSDQDARSGLQVLNLPTQSVTIWFPHGPTTDSWWPRSLTIKGRWLVGVLPASKTKIPRRQCLHNSVGWHENSLWGKSWRHKQIGSKRHAMAYGSLTFKQRHWCQLAGYFSWQIISTPTFWNERYPNSSKIYQLACGGKW